MSTDEMDREAAAREASERYSNGVAPCTCRWEMARIGYRFVYCYWHLMEAQFRQGQARP